MAGLLLVISLLMFGQIIFVIIVFTTKAIPLPAFTILIFVPLFFGVLLLWIHFSTSCEITAEHFAVRFGPLRFQIPLERIVRVTPTRKLWGGPAWGFALSFDRIHVWYRKKNGHVAWLPIAVSPEDKAEVIRELARAVPNLKVE